MFVDKSEWKPFELRQGDILAGIPFPFVTPDTLVLGKIPVGQHEKFPALTAHTHTHRDANDATYFTGQATMKLSLCVVTTQCCELRCNNRNKLREVAAISICRIVPVTHSILNDPEKLLSLQENRDPRVPDRRCHKNYFYVGNGFDGGVHMMVDYSQSGCIPREEFPAVMENKILQMNDLSRMKFKIKFGVFVAKPTDEENAAGIAQDPWKNEVEVVAEHVERGVPVPIARQQPESATIPRTQ